MNKTFISTLLFCWRPNNS